MSGVLLRRKGLGKSSCTGLSAASGLGVVFAGAPGLTEADWVFRWGCTASLPAGFKGKVVNNAKAIHLASDKAASRKVLVDFAPQTWFQPEEVTKYPVVVRPRHHAQGKQLWFCTNQSQVTRAWEATNCDGYISEFVDKVREFRVAGVGGRCVWVAEKTPADPKAIAWNVAQGGKFTNVRFGSWPLEVVRVGLLSIKMLELDFGGADLMVDAEGAVYVLEVNSAPSQTSPYRQECMGKAFKWLMENGLERVALGKNMAEWRSFVHPAVSGEALL